MNEISVRNKQMLKRNLFKKMSKMLKKKSTKKRKKIGNGLAPIISFIKVLGGIDIPALLGK
ncbi:MAG: hypothetical protein Q8K66_01530 [Sediminibacterium sp.]|nr:hypothetical protein [Sediminibacterium sp.]MDP3127761.1 hypothetical protein [Sediminibacterium sp.]